MLHFTHKYVKYMSKNISWHKMQIIVYQQQTNKPAHPLCFINLNKTCLQNRSPFWCSQKWRKLQGLSFIFVSPLKTLDPLVFTCSFASFSFFSSLYSLPHLVKYFIRHLTPLCWLLWNVRCFQLSTERYFDTMIGFCCIQLLSQP